MGNEKMGRKRNKGNEKEKRVGKWRVKGGRGRGGKGEEGEGVRERAVKLPITLLLL